MNLARWALSWVAMFLLLAGSVGVSHTASDCAAPLEMIRFKTNLPNTARAIRSGKNLVIVALGSSSTQGVGASNSTHTYPALLAEDLRRRWPQLPVTVINKGIGGEMAFQMLARFERDVLPYHPQLVIWQTGSNQALRSMDIDGYTATIREGISRLKAAQIDVVLMDPQFAPRVIARPMHLLVVDVIAALATEMKVPVFRRFALMRQWVSSGEYQMEDIISRDGLHMNDVSYGCVARLLADSLASAVGPETHARRQSHHARAASR
ncbi:MAG TPA: GDSL-type esterase/lipase family protein [Candidatus Binatia bacterium]